MSCFQLTREKCCILRFAKNVAIFSAVRPVCLQLWLVAIGLQACISGKSLAPAHVTTITCSYVQYSKNIGGKIFW